MYIVNLLRMFISGPFSAESQISLTEGAIREAIKILQFKVKREYANGGSCMKRLQWLKKIPLGNYFVDLTMVEKKGSKKCRNRQLKYEDIFLPSNDGEEAPKTILVLGGAGFGKSTLVTKIVHDWSTKINSPLSKFKVIIPCRLQDVPVGTDLEEYLLDWCSEILKDELEEKVPRVTTRSVLKCLRDDLLIALDGYDELNEDQRSSVNKILSKDSFFHSSTFFVTSRPDELEDDFHNSFQRHISISPLSQESRELMVDKEFEEDSNKADRVKLFLKNRAKDFLSELSPLLLYAVCYAFDDKQIENINRGSDLIYEVTRVMFRRAYIKENGETTSEEVSDTLSRLGKFFLDKLKDKTLKFKDNELIDVLKCDKGFLSVVGLFQPVWVSNQEYWGTIQKVYMEALAADYLNKSLQRTEHVTQSQEVISEMLVNLSQTKTIIFRNKTTKIIAFSGTVGELVYVTFENRSVYDGIFETYDDLKAQFYDYTCRFKDSSYPYVFVFDERNSRWTMNEYFGESSLQSSKKLTPKVWPTGTSGPCQLVPKTSEKHASTGTLTFMNFSGRKWPEFVKDLCILPSQVFNSTDVWSEVRICLKYGSTITSKNLRLFLN